MTVFPLHTPASILLKYISPIHHTPGRCFKLQALTMGLMGGIELKKMVVLLILNYGKRI